MPPPGTDGLRQHEGEKGGDKYAGNLPTNPTDRELIEQRIRVIDELIAEHYRAIETLEQEKKQCRQSLGRGQGYQGGSDKSSSKLDKVKGFFRKG